MKKSFNILLSFCKVISLFSLLFFYALGQSYAFNAELLWNESDSDIEGYRVYQSDQSGVYIIGPGNEVATVPKGTETVTLENIPDGIWYWVVTAYDTEGFESNPSNEASNFGIVSPQNGFYVNPSDYTAYPTEGTAIIDIPDDIFVKSDSNVIGGPFAVDASGKWAGTCDFSSVSEGTVNLTAQSNGFISAIVTGTYDRTPPTSSASAPTDVGGRLSIMWSASDENAGVETSGVASTYLWHKPPGATQLTNTGSSQQGTSGTFYYYPSYGDGTYYFATRSVDRAGNWEAEPNGDGDTSINYIASINTGPTGKEGGGGGCFITTAAPD